MEDYQDVNDNKIKFKGKTIANVESDGEVRQLELLITTRQAHPLLGLDWMEELGKTLKSETPHHTINHIDKPDTDITTLKVSSTNFLQKPHNNIIEVDIQLKKEAKLIQQKSRPITIHLQPAVEKEIEKLKKAGTHRISVRHRRNLFCESCGNHNKQNKSVKKELDSRKMNEITVKRKAQMTNMEKLISRISRKIADGPADEIWISKFDLDYAYGQLQPSKKAMDLGIIAVTGGNFTGYYGFLKGFYVLADIPTIFKKKMTIH